MKHHLKAKTREEPDHVILHVGTNDMNSDRENQNFFQNLQSIVHSRAVQLMLEFLI